MMNTWLRWQQFFFPSLWFMVLSLWVNCVWAASPTGVGYSLIQTSESSGAQEMMVVSGGNWLKRRHLVHNAVLITHPQGDLLFDTGLGKAIDDQTKVWSWFTRSQFGYEAVKPVVDQLQANHYDFKRLRALIPSHLHWDHASGLEDFPGVPVWITKAEYDFALMEGTAPGFLSSQYDSEQINWQFIELTSQPFKGFESSLDIYGDGSVVLIGLPGHTPGHVGLLLTLDSGRQLLFIGDTTWTVEGVQNQQPRPIFVDWIVKVDWDKERNMHLIEQLYRLSQQEPGLIIIPAHDELVAKTLSHYPEIEH